MAGRPRINITPDVLTGLYDTLNNWDLVADELGVSRVTVFRRLKEFGMLKKYYWK